MRKKIVVSLFILFVNFTYAKNILIVGDSHSVGPFGHKLFELVKDSKNNVALYAHSSSASRHWMNSSPSLLSGGAHHAMSINNVNKVFPFPDWRIKQPSLYYPPLLDDMIYHPDWKLQNKIKPDIVIISLGANDYGAVTTEEGEYNSYGYQANQKKIMKMLEVTEKKNIPCLWVLPPNGIKKVSKRQGLLYSFLKESIQNRCHLVDSSEFKTTGCDGIHFSCSSQREKAYLWATKVMQELKIFL